VSNLQWDARSRCSAEYGGSDFHHEKDEQHLEPDRHGNQKIAGDDPLGMILDERSPVLRGVLVNPVDRRGQRISPLGARLARKRGYLDVSLIALQPYLT